MSDELLPGPHDRAPTGPPPEVRERVVMRCRQAMAERQASARRRQTRWRWSFALSVTALLLVNIAEERQCGRRIAALTGGPRFAHARMAEARRSSPVAIGSLRARRLLLAALLRDPNSL